MNLKSLHLQCNKRRPLYERLRKAALLICVLVLSPVCVYADIKVSGQVLDENDEPLIGVSVTEADTKNGTVTDVDGNFYITVKGGSSVLEFSYVGYKPFETRVGKKLSFTVRMEPRLDELEEVVVVGYGKQQRASVVGAITTIEPEELRVGHTANVQDNLAGQLAGVIAYKPSGEPGWDKSSFWIRGISSFAGSTDPLVLIDGVERSLSDIDAAEIESFSILKDAAASAVYGVRGANGVLIVNTKRGKIGAPQVSFRIEQAFREPIHMPEFIGAVEYMNLINELASEKGIEVFDPVTIERTASRYDPERYADVNWLDAIMRDNCSSTRANLGISGGSDFLRYALTASWYRESGLNNRDKTLPYDTSTNLNKINVRANVDMNVTKTTLVTFNVGGYIQRMRKHTSGDYWIFVNAFDTPPYVHPAVYSDGKLPQINGRANPWANLTQKGYRTYNFAQIQALVSVEQNLNMLIEGFKARALFSFDNYSTYGMWRSRIPTFYAPATARDEEGNLILGQPLNSDGTDYLTHGKGVDPGQDGFLYNRMYFEAALNYDRTFNGQHRVGAMMLYNLTNYDDYGIQPYRHQGVAGRFSYTFDDRYVAEFNFGYNGSENFAPGKRYGFFPSGAIGWVISNEPFWEPIILKVNKLKLRASAGKTGNDQIQGRRFAYITTLNQNNDGYRFGTTNNYYAGAGITEGEVGVTNLTWETVDKYNIGLEIGLWQMLDLQVDFFKEYRKNIFIQRSVIPTQAGFASAPWANYGKVKNGGFEVSLDFHKAITKDLSIGIRGNATYAKNTITESDDPVSVLNSYRSRNGQSIGAFWGFTADGLYTFDDFDENGNLRADLPRPEIAGAQGVRPGDIKYVDRNKDGVINTQDEGYLEKTYVPRLVYGFGGNLIYKNFDFNFFFQGTGDSYRMMSPVGTNLVPGSGQGTLGNIFSNYNDRWTEENPSQDVFWPRLTYGLNTNNEQHSTWYLKDMSFLRLKSVEIGYTLPRKWTKKFACSQFRVYVSGNDILTFSKFKLWDPELATFTGAQYPLLRSFMVGAELKF